MAGLLAYAATASGPSSGMPLGRSLLTCALPAGMALACAAVVAREPMLELHLSLPTPYVRTVARRLAWPAVVSAVTASMLLTSVAVTGRLLNPVAVLWELVGLTVLLVGGAVWATVQSRSSGPATGLVVAVVLAKLLLVDPLVPEGAVQALPALLAGTWLTALALRTLGPGGRPAARLGRVARSHFGAGEA
ncbi:hypothetical protein ACFY12_21465 [Streptomyces sp. NPDC001339]|uniref:hypothetical protein n=1 Tax=Streptomyces sp. NPDC001339 TaxID=3364563 RepID=UPI0036C2E5B7